MSHKRGRAIDWAKVDDDIAQMRYDAFGIPKMADPFAGITVVSARPTDYEWETVCQGCHTRLLYIAPEARSNVVRCDRCKKKAKD